MCNLVNIPMSIFPEVKPTRYVHILALNPTINTQNVTHSYVRLVDVYNHI